MPGDDKIDRRWQRIEERNAKKMLAIWERSRKELFAGLLESGPTDQSLTAQHRQKMLLQVERQIERLKPETSTLLTAIGSDGLAEGAKNASKDVGLSVGLSRLNPELVALQAEKAKIAVKAVTDDLQNKIRMELAVAQAQGLHAKEAARRIAGNTGLTLDGLKKPVFKSVAQRAEAIARNEFATAANSQYLQTLKDMEKEDGIKLKKMYAGPGVGDPRISKVCKALMSKYGLNEDQAIALDELFDAGGFKGLAPPAHPRCRHRMKSVTVDDAGSVSGGGSGGGRRPPVPPAGGGGDDDDLEGAFGRLGNLFSVPGNPDFLEAWRRNISIGPEEFYVALSKDLPGRMFLSAPSFNEGILKLEIEHVRRGREVFLSERTLNFISRQVSHDAAIVSQEYQGQGYGKVFIRNCVDLYERLGMGAVRVSAGLTTGGYANARFGFVPTIQSWEMLKPDLRRRFEEYQGQFSSDVAELLHLALGSGDPSIISVLALIGEEADGIKLGKILLLGTRWDGILNLVDADSLAIFRAYVQNARVVQ